MKTLSFYEQLVSSLEYLAASYEEQVEVVPKFVWVGDDVLSSFDGVWVLLPQIVESGALSLEAIAGILRLEREIWLVINDPTIEPVDDFASHPRWMKIRELAATALTIMGEPLGRPVKDNPWLYGNTGDYLQK